MNSLKGNNQLLNDKSIISLFNFIHPSKEDYPIDINLLILHIKKCENTGPNIQKEMYTATLRDSKTKYNGFIFVKNPSSPELIENSLVNIKSIGIKKFDKQPSRVFVIRTYEIVLKFYSFDLNSNNAILIRDNDGKVTFDNGLPIDFEDISKDNIDNNLNNENEINNRFDSDEIEDFYDGYTSLKHLTTFSRDFIIFVRVTKKSEIKNFSQNTPGKSAGKLFYFIVLDRDGSEMQVTCFNKAADKFYDEVKENEVYEIKGGYVKINDKKFTTVKSDYKIVLDENSSIIRKNDSGIIKTHNLSFIKINQIQSIPLYSIIDLCAVVLEVTDKVTKHTRNGDQFMKKIVIGDSSKYKIELSLWRVHANLDVRVGDLILLKHVKVGDFNGRNISTFDETSIVLNPSNIKEINELSLFVSSYKEQYLELDRSGKDGALMGGGISMDGDKYNISYIKDILDTLDETEDVSNFSWIKATVTQIIHNEKNYYMGCGDKNCKRKLILNDAGKYTCPSCNKIYDRPTYYYTLSVRVKDCSFEFWIDIFGKNAESLMKMTAEEYKDILMSRNVVKLKEISDKIEFKQFYFSIKPKMQMYHTSVMPKKKIYAYKIESVNMNIHARKLLGYIKKVLN